MYKSTYKQEFFVSSGKRSFQSSCEIALKILQQVNENTRLPMLNGKARRAKILKIEMKTTNSPVPLKQWLDIHNIENHKFFQ